MNCSDREASHPSGKQRKAEYRHQAALSPSVREEVGGDGGGCEMATRLGVVGIVVESPSAAVEINAVLRNPNCANQF